MSQLNCWSPSIVDSISGLTPCRLPATGADFVVQLATTFSSLVRGVGVFAGQPFHCAVTYFPGDNLSKAEGKALEEVPHCSGCPEGKVIHCACQSFVKRFTRPSLQTFLDETHFDG